MPTAGVGQTVAIVQARFGSTRLPGKIARPLGGGRLARVVARLAMCRRVAQIVVATGDGPADRRIGELLPASVAVFCGSEHDVLGRFAAALAAHAPQATGVLRVCADNPFLDPELIDQLIADAESRPAADYASFRLSDGRPTVLSPIGVFAEWCRAEAIRQAAAETTDLADREHVTRIFYTHPERYNVRLLNLPPGLEREDLRLTVDFEDDWRHVAQIDAALAPGPLTWQRISQYVDGQPELAARMAVLNRANRK